MLLKTILSLLTVLDLVYSGCVLDKLHRNIIVNSVVILRVKIIAPLEGRSTLKVDTKTIYKGEQKLHIFINNMNGNIHESGRIELPLNAIANVPLECRSNWNSHPTDVLFIGVFDKFPNVILRPWKEEEEVSIWEELGWTSWSEWGPCSISCGSGIQQRRRHCRETSGCDSYNIEQRDCNLFNCLGAVDLLGLPRSSPVHWTPTKDRPSAWSLRPKDGGYLWLPANSVYPLNLSRSVPQEFTVMATLRTDPKALGQGTLLSMRSRRPEGSYLSLEMAAHGGRLVHADHSGSDAVSVVTNMTAGLWHQLAVSISESEVTCYLDCALQSSFTLAKDSFSVPKDVDFIVGYLMEGDLEQLTVVPDGNSTHLQCSPNSVTIVDTSVDTLLPHTIHKILGHKHKQRKRKRKRPKNGKNIKHKAHHHHQQKSTVTLHSEQSKV